MIIAAQIRGARSALGWSAADLAKASGLSLRTVQTLERETENEKVRKSSWLAAKAALEEVGIEFIGSPSDAPGIRIHPNPQSKIQ